MSIWLKHEAMMNRLVEQDTEMVQEITKLSRETADLFNEIGEDNILTIFDC